MHIVGCTAEQIQYAMGHRIENNAIDRRDFRNEDRLRGLTERLNKRPSVNKAVLIPKCHTVSGGKYHNDDFIDEKIRLPMRKGKIIIRISSHEALTPASIAISVPQNVSAIRCKYYEREDLSPQNREVNVLNDYYADFRKAYQELDEKQESECVGVDCKEKSPGEIQ